MSTTLIVVFIVINILYLYTPISSIQFAVYLLIFLVAVYFFVSNLSKLSRARVTSSNEVQTEDDVELDKHQRKLSNLASKYMLLFGIAIGSSTMSHFSIFFVNDGSIR